MSTKNYFFNNIHIMYILDNQMPMFQKLLTFIHYDYLYHIQIKHKLIQIQKICTDFTSP